MNKSIRFTSIFVSLCSIPLFSSEKDKQPSSPTVSQAAWGLLDALYNGTSNYVAKTLDPQSYIGNTVKSKQVYQNGLKIIDDIESGTQSNINDLNELCRQIKHRSGTLSDLVAEAIQKGDSVALSTYLKKPTVHFMPPLLQELARAHLRKTKDAIDPHLDLFAGQPLVTGQFPTIAQPTVAPIYPPIITHQQTSPRDPQQPQRPAKK